MLDLSGKWVLVTGAARGIGRLAALKMADCGCNLILHSRDVSHTASLEEELKAKGVLCHSVAADLNDIPSVLKMLEKIDTLGVDVDVVLNNAGLQIAYRTEYYKTPADDYEVSFNVNTIAPAMICYHFLPKMTERGFGRIVNTTSGIDKEPEQAGYSAAKAALDKITKDMASKLGQIPAGAGQISAAPMLPTHLRVRSPASSSEHLLTTASTAGSSTHRIMRE